MNPAVDHSVPVREGEYGSRIAAVEPGGIEFIALTERHGKPIDLFWTWVAPNLEFASIYVGTIGIVLFGGSFWSVVAGILVGAGLAALAHGALSTWGSRLGIPQMVQSRAAFGFRGNLIPAGINAFISLIGWFIVNSVSGAFAVLAFLGLPSSAFWIVYLAIVIVQVTVASIGHNLVHAFARYVFVPLVLTFSVASAFVLSRSSAVAFNPSAPLAAGGDIGAFMLTMATTFGLAASWSPFASDYTRYLPLRTSARAIGVAAGLGIFIPIAALAIAGAGLATVAGTLWGPEDIPTAQLAHAMPDVVYRITLLAIALGGVAANALNIYSGAMSFLTLGINVSLRLRRAIVAIASGALGFMVGIFLQANVGPGSKYEQFLLLTSYWVAPWLGVVVADWWLRRGDFGDESIFFATSHNPWRGVVSWLIAGAIAVSLFAAQEIYSGPFAIAVPQLGDLTPVVGFGLAAGVYVALSVLRFAPGSETEHEQAQAYRARR